MSCQESDGRAISGACKYSNSDCTLKCTFVTKRLRDTCVFTQPIGEKCAPLSMHTHDILMRISIIITQSRVYIDTVLYDDLGFRRTG